MILLSLHLEKALYFLPLSKDWPDLIFFTFIVLYYVFLPQAALKKTMEELNKVKSVSTMQDAKNVSCNFQLHRSVSFDQPHNYWVTIFYAK